MQKIYQKIDGQPVLVAIIEDVEYATAEEVAEIKNTLDNLQDSELITGINEALEDVTTRLESLEGYEESIAKIDTIEEDLNAVKETLKNVATQDDLNTVNEELTEIRRKVNDIKNRVTVTYTDAEPGTEEFERRITLIQEGGLVAYYEDVDDEELGGTADDDAVQDENVEDTD